jgi:hypothetical protein
MRFVKPRLIFVFFILVNIGQTFAQSADAPETSEVTKTPETAKKGKPVYRIGLGSGFSFTGYREETDVPLNRYLDVFNFNMNGNIEYNIFYYTFNFLVLSGETKPLDIKNNEEFFTYTQKRPVFLRLYFDNAFDVRLWGNNAFPGYLGGAIRGDVYYSALKESINSSFTMLFSLNIHVTQKWIISKGKEFVLSAGIPLFGYAVRPSYYGLSYTALDEEDDIISLHNYRAVFGDLKYYHKINEWLNIYGGLGFELSLITFPQPRKDAAFCINAGIAFSF